MKIGDEKPHVGGDAAPCQAIGRLLVQAGKQDQPAAAVGRRAQINESDLSEQDEI